ncbi:cytochrome P450 [Streptomyces erythrochromogenes]|uniref:cytochrome P450 n=1 Tax=Streptomyces erythrochromogenes TaxID=285574 RepID=UPI0037F55F03
MTFDSGLLLAEETARNPYPVFSLMREEDPVYWHADTNSWYVTSYALITELLREPMLSACPGDYVGEQRPEDLPVVKQAEAFFNSWMVFSDPPHQTRLRQTVAPAFPRRTAEAWAGYARDLAGDLLGRIRQGETDLHNTFSLPLATRLTCAVLGVPAQDDARVRQWSNDLIGFLSTPIADPRRAAVAMQAVSELQAYLGSVVVPALRSATDERLIALRGIADLDPSSALALFTQLLTGGVDPVASSLTTSLGVLADWEPERREALLADSDLMEAVVEEALRFDAPFHFIPRTTMAPMNIGSHALGPGQRVVLVIAAANRDPDQFDRPDEFLPGRPGPVHLSFGLGKHYCLGAMLARVVLRESMQCAARWMVESAVRRPRGERLPAFGATTWSRMMVSV